MRSCQWKANFGIKQALEKYFLKKNKNQQPNNRTHTHTQPTYQTRQPPDFTSEKGKSVKFEPLWS